MPNAVPLIPLIRAVRPRQWTKNVLLFAGLLLSRQVFHFESVLRSLEGFIIFCMASGGIYLLNDLLDAPRDRMNPRKMHRPIASGELGPGLAGITSLVLMGASLLFGFLVSVPFGMCTGAYLMAMIAYCVSLKNIFLIDAMIIALGFVIRAIAGVIVLRTPQQEVPLTVWFVVCIIFLSLFVALCKRRSELVRLSAGAVQFRPVLALYTTVLLDQLTLLCATGAVLSYTLYATTLRDPWMMLTTLPFVLYGVFRYMHLVFSMEDGEAPEETLLSDRPLLGCVILWSVALGFVFLST